VLLLVGALFRQLADDFLSESCGLSEHIVQSVKHLFEMFGSDWGPVVRHSCRNDYRRRVLP
jgi:hypothetical protein